MEQFDFENTTIFREINKLSSEEIKKWVGFILDKNFETRGKYFSDKIGKLKPEGGFVSFSEGYFSTSEFEGEIYDILGNYTSWKQDEKDGNTKGSSYDSFFGDEFDYHSEGNPKDNHIYSYRIGKSAYSKYPLKKKGIKISVWTNNKDIISTKISHRKPTIGTVGFFKKINILSEWRDFGLYPQMDIHKNIKEKKGKIIFNKMSSDGLSFLSKVLDNSKYEFVIKFIKHYNSLLEGSLMDYRESIEREKELLRIKNEKIQKKKEKIELDKQKTSEKKNSLIKELDKDSDGILDIVQTDDFQEILKKHEKNIIEIDRDYIKNFVKLSNYLKTIRNNLQNTFEILSKVEFSKDLVPLTKILKNKIHTYNSLLLHSLSMIVSLTKDEMITFYEIYEMFDELNVFDSKHEKDMLNGIKSINSELGEVNKNLKEVGGKLGDISGQFYNLMNQMKESDERIINSIDDLTYTTSSSIESLSNNVQSELQSINSSIKFNNLLTAVQTYQMYKINLNTKSLKG